MMKCFPLFLMLFTAAAWADPAARFQGSGKADPIRVKNLRELSSPVAEVRFLAFDLAWDHSWRAAWSEPAERHGGDKPLKLESWDAAWVFVKFRRPGDDRWNWNAFKNDPQSERAVTVSNEKGLNFKGTHGLGSLTLPADWPQADAVGSGIRCSLYGYGIFDLARPRLSDRLFAAIAEPNRRPSHKWRGVRTAPRIKKNQ